MDFPDFVNLSATQLIQLMIAPAVMINACGLLLLGTNNKYSLVVNRIRLLNDEKRKLTTRIVDHEFSYDENVRLESIAKQINLLVYRVRLVRNSVFLYTISIGLFVLTSILIGLNSFFQIDGINLFALFSFISGMITLLSGVIYAAAETLRGYEIINYEVKTNE